MPNAEYRANAKGEPPSQADGHNAHIEQHNACCGANGRSNPETGIDDQINASAHSARESARQWPN